MIKNLITIFMDNLPYLIKAAKTAPEIIGFIQRTQKTLEQTEEWSEGDQAEFDRQLETVTSQPHWKPNA